MDHDNFETHMIDFVNRNAEEAEVVRNDNLREARETEGYLRRCKTINATIEAILWGAFVVCIMIVMSFAHWIDFIPAEIAIAVCTMFAFIAGMRVTALVVRINKYGGRA